MLDVVYDASFYFRTLGAYAAVLYFTVWDLRSFKKPVSSKTEMTTLYPQTNAIFSPDDKYVVTGVGTSARGGPGKLLFMSKDSLEVVKELVIDSSPVKVVWHSKINQVSWIILSQLWGLLFRSIGREAYITTPCSSVGVLAC
jgi:hypothetical protein